MDLSVSILQLVVQDGIPVRDCSALVEKYERVAAELKVSFPEAWQTLDMLLPTEDKDVLHPICSLHSPMLLQFNFQQPQRLGRRRLGGAV